MALVNSTMRVVALLSIVPLVGGVAPSARTADNGPRVAAPRQPESPAFGLVPVGPNQSMRVNVVCFLHKVGDVPPGPCRGMVMMHDAAGAVLRQGTYDLQPGETAQFEFRRPPSLDASPILIDPCWIPDPGGRIVPSAEVFDNTTGRVVLYVNPAAARTGDLWSGKLDPGSLVGFNPQPDPPGFGLVTLTPAQSIRMHVWCSAHGINGHPPDPCRGTVMFHDALGNLLQSSTYELEPGKGGTFGLGTRVIGDVALGMTIIPCIIPSPGGRAVPNIEVLDGNGETALLINPAVARMSQIDQ